MEGGLWDRRSRLLVAGVETATDPGNGALSMGRSADLWHLGYRVDPAANYAQRTHRKKVLVQSGQTILVSLPVAKKDRLLAGIVLDPAGDSYPQTTVMADSASGCRTQSTAGGPEAGYLNPAIKRLLVPPGTTPGIEPQRQLPPGHRRQPGGHGDRSLCQLCPGRQRRYHG